ncbi:hypothetical protein RFI_14695 [Reticulomyxa filosa]|uniref:Uncharacterized protein n=1 Tax=Reticulomyxa filosa TaxID=46433 RepID=X6N8A2_RETFI|nr:hypothetical protein RFI_14695 [Reticulomyxa filosa]|eukprot:ETO22505.1 hypothetical protein RFI_14695 [Reticulomyxa filosa]
MMKELENKHKEILSKFDKSNPKLIPKEMIETMEYINSRDPSKHPPQIRLLCSQLIQDYAVMYKSVEEKEPDHRVFELCKAWLDFQPSNDQMQIDQINHRYALTLRR